MNNLQKLYQTIFDAGLINNSFDDFSEGMLSEDYQKKVFDAITERGFLIKTLILLNLHIHLKNLKVVAGIVLKLA